MDLPSLDKPSEAGFNLYCVNYIPAKPIDAGGFSDSGQRLGPGARFSVGGETQAEVARVEVSYEDGSGERVQAPVIFGKLSGELAARTGVPYEWGRFIAFLPDDGTPDTAAGPLAMRQPWIESIEVRAFDDAGEEIGFDPFGKELATAASRAAVERQHLRGARQMATKYDELAEAARGGELKADVDGEHAALVLQLLADLIRGDLDGSAAAIAREQGVRFRVTFKALQAAGDLGKLGVPGVAGAHRTSS